MTAAPALPPGYTLAAFETIASTNDEAKTRAAAGAPAGTVVWARAQAAGRGRQDRIWVSPPGNLYCSVILRPERTATSAATLGFVAALAAADAIESVADGRHPSLKWPNDVLLDGRKIAGILLEGGGNGAWVVVGCGVNLASFPEGTSYPATALRALTGRDVSAADMLGAYCAALDGWYRLWREEGFAPLREAWLARAHPPGTTLTVRTPTASLSGTFEGLDEAGVLLLTDRAGGLHRIAAGDVYFASAIA